MCQSFAPRYKCAKCYKFGDFRFAPLEYSDKHQICYGCFVSCMIKSTEVQTIASSSLPFVFHPNNPDLLFVNLNRPVSYMTAVKKVKSNNSSTILIINHFVEVSSKVKPKMAETEETARRQSQSSARS